jgi:hypothetical protein
VVSVRADVVFGSRESVARSLKESNASGTINTSFVERHNATDRHHNARKARRSYRFSKDWQIHEAVGYFTYYTYNFCWRVRTLARPLPPDSNSRAKKRPRAPAMAAGLTDHVWELKEWLERPIAVLSN